MKRLKRSWVVQELSIKVDRGLYKEDIKERVVGSIRVWLNRGGLPIEGVFDRPMSFEDQSTIVQEHGDVINLYDLEEAVVIHYHRNLPIRCCCRYLSL